MKEPSTTNPELPVLFHPANQFAFARVPVWVLSHPDLSLGAKLLFGRLLGHAGERDYAWPSQQHLAETFDVSKRTISTWVKELKEAELIHVTRRRDTSAIYRFPVDSWPAGSLKDREAAISKARQLSDPETRDPSSPEQHETSDRREHLEENTTELDQVLIDHSVVETNASPLFQEEPNSKDQETKDASSPPLVFSSYGKRIAEALEAEFGEQLGPEYLNALAKLEELQLEIPLIVEEVQQHVRIKRSFPDPVNFSALFVSYEVQRLLNPEAAEVA